MSRGQPRVPAGYVPMPNDAGGRSYFGASGSLQGPAWLVSCRRAGGGESQFLAPTSGLPAWEGGWLRLARRIGVGQLIGRKIGEIHVSVGVVILAATARHKFPSRAVVAVVEVPVMFRWHIGYGA